MEKDNIYKLESTYRNAYAFLPDEYHHYSTLEFINSVRTEIRNKIKSWNIPEDLKLVDEKSSNYELFQLFMGMTAVLSCGADGLLEDKKIFNDRIKDLSSKELFGVYLIAIDHYLGTLPKQ